jgi:tRNA pseudouridine38-40 synthase
VTVRLLVAYDGTDFAGYQVQPGERTVQGVLQDALARITQAPVELRVAGRTDAGVHALGQVVSFEGDDADTDVLLRSLARVLPADISVLDAQNGPDGFDARRSASWREYVYLLWTSETRHPLYDRYVHWVRRPTEAGLLNEALDVVVGTHDFSSFARVRPEQDPQRTIHEITCTDEGPLVRIRIVGASFLHNMVRSIVGSALEVGSGRQGGAWMRRALLARDRAAAGPVAPAQGLTLVDVGYDQAPWPRRTPVAWPWSDRVLRTDERAGGIG